MILCRFAIVPLRDVLWFALSVGVVWQEGARVLCFVLVKKAQK